MELLSGNHGGTGLVIDWSVTPFWENRGGTGLVIDWSGTPFWENHGGTGLVIYWNIPRWNRVLKAMEWNSMAVWGGVVEPTPGSLGEDLLTGINSRWNRVCR